MTHKVHPTLEGDPFQKREVSRGKYSFGGFVWGFDVNEHDTESISTQHMLVWFVLTTLLLLVTFNRGVVSVNQHNTCELVCVNNSVGS